MTERSPPVSRAKSVTTWVLQILLAALFIAVGSLKLIGAPMMVQIFEQIGVGQWFRYVTGVVEISGGALLLTSVTAPFGAALLAATMVGAVCTHLLRIGGNPLPAIILLALSVAVLWLRRNQVITYARRILASA